MTQADRRIRARLAGLGLLAAVTIAVAGVAAPRWAAAYSDGIVGFSGRNNTTCTPTCHIGGEAPDVVFEAPQGTEMTAGTIATFRLTITSNNPAVQTHAGFDVAPSRGTIGVVDEAGTRTIPGLPDITHTMPRANDEQGVAVFEFTWEAPPTPGVYTLFGAGNSVDLDGESAGDASGAATLDINVIAASTPTPTVTSTAPPTSTASPVPCTGDCDGGGSVTVDEIVRGVNIALGDRPPEDCPAFDRDSGGSVTVDEIVEAIGNALGGCG